MHNPDKDVRDGLGRRLVIDRTLCEGHAVCEVVAPELFGVGDDDQTHLLVSDLTNDAVALADSAVSECPRGALSWLLDQAISETGRSLDHDLSGDTA
jgi:ferredoxin